MAPRTGTFASAWRTGGGTGNPPTSGDVHGPMARDIKDPSAALDAILSEADTLIRRRLKELALEVPHVVVAVTPGGQVILCANVSAGVLRCFGEDLQNVADELTAPPEPGDTSH